MDILDNFIKKIKSVFKKRSEVDWIDNAYAKIEQQYKDKHTVTFRICNINKNNFQVKIGGLYAYIPIWHMPWQYLYLESWHVILPTLIGKVFRGRIYSINRTPLSIHIDASMPQFKTITPDVNVPYSGIIIRKSDKSIILDIGYHFDWKFGSLISRLHSTAFKSPETFEDCIPGQVMSIYFAGFYQLGVPIARLTPLSPEWHPDYIHSLIGKIVKVKVGKTEREQPVFIVEEKYEGRLPIDIHTYPDNLGTMRRAFTMLSNDDILFCEITGADFEKQYLTLKWNGEKDTFDPHFTDEIKRENSSIDFKEAEGLIKNGKSKLYNEMALSEMPLAMNDAVLIDDGHATARELIGKIVNVRVIKKHKSQVFLLVEGKYSGVLPITSNIYYNNARAVKEHFNQLPDGELISCKVLGFDERLELLTLQWYNETGVGEKYRNSIKNLLDLSILEKLKKLEE